MRIGQSSQHHGTQVRKHWNTADWLCPMAPKHSSKTDNYSLSVGDLKNLCSLSSREVEELDDDDEDDDGDRFISSSLKNCFNRESQFSKRLVMRTSTLSQRVVQQVSGLSCCA